MGRKCIIDECENEISDRSKLDVCSVCRSALCRWDKRPTGEVLEYKGKLTKYHARMSTLVGEDTRDTRKRGVAQPGATQSVYRLTKTKFIPTARANSITGQVSRSRQH